jgi:hypothetical protein
VIIWVRLKPAATMNMQTIVTTVVLPKDGSAVLTSVHPVIIKRTITSIEVTDIGIFLMKNETIINAKMIKHIVIWDISSSSLLNEIKYD